MENILLWFWTILLAATVGWWVIMLFRVALIGPAELRAMFRSLNEAREDKKSANSDRPA
jgi:hypothetical protein